jgi:hypothetical protein
VCVVAEANAWPYRDPAHEDELVHWVAHRVASGESFECVVAPRNPLSPRTSRNISIAEEALLSAGGMAELRARWGSFNRPRDVICSWGHYSNWLFINSGGLLPNHRVDIRKVAHNYVNAKVGTAEEFAARMGVSVDVRPLGRGRAGTRLARLVAITRMFMKSSNEASCRHRA